MKQFFIAIFAILSVFVSDNSFAQSASSGSNILVAVYSWSGNTKHAAEVIAKTLKADLFEIKPVNEYPSDYQLCIDKAKKDINSGFKPELKALPKNIENYDIIFLGSPNWWGTKAPPIDTFIINARIKGKKVIPFFTHGSGGMQSCEKNTKAAAEAAGAIVLPATHWYGSEISSLDSEIAVWASKTLESAK